MMLPGEIIGMPVNEPVELDDTPVRATFAVVPSQGNREGRPYKIELEIPNKQKDILALEIRQIKAGYR